ncbi:MAG: 5-formyltetrahydrofolate cyclo-ligase [Gemmatimonadetes bacterium]|nr:5-formyltetrahydrofolate cyclo-ligase [Gemmatimonadota bacterium]
MEALRAAIPAEEREAASDAIGRRLFASTAWRDARSIHAYVGVGPEVATVSILERAWTEGKRVACPKVVWRPQGLTAYVVGSLQELVEGRRGLREPDPDRASVAESRFDLVLVPGLAFDRRGGRIGYGAGFYDRFLTEVEALKVGLAYNLQLIDSVPVEAHDVRVDRILTEKEAIDCRIERRESDRREEA